MLLVGMTGFEPATTRPPDVYSNRAELHPEFHTTVFRPFGCANIALFLQSNTLAPFFFENFFPPREAVGVEHAEIEAQT